MGHVLGFVVGVSGTGIVVAAIVDFADRGPDGPELLALGLAVATLGLVLWAKTEVPTRFTTATVFATVAVSWLALATVAALPYLVTGTFDRLDNALFEAISGITTTGASVLSPIEGTSKGILLWRSTTQWLGGMGVIVLIVAVLPVFGTGGLALLHAEAPGDENARLDPRVRFTARRLWSLYVWFTAAIAFGYWVTGMSLFDAVNYSFTTISTGGFGTKDSSFVDFGAGTQWVAIVAMFLSGVSFALYWRALRGKPLVLFRSAEFRAYTCIVVGVTAAAVISNRGASGISHDAIREQTLSVFSIATSTGYTLTDYDLWVPAVKVLLLALMALGAMAGSTSGGLKVIRLVTVVQFARRELQRALHPRLVRPVRVGKQPLDEEIVSRVMGFTMLFLAVILGATMLVAASGADVVTSLSAVATSIGNIGPGLGAVGPTHNFLSLDPAGRGVLMAVMLLGRLELFPLILAFAAVPAWRRRRARVPSPSRRVSVRAPLAQLDRATDS
jgi:trk system potassium uptake protein TrkH